MKTASAFFVDCQQPAYPTIDAVRLRVRQLPGWHVVGMATGHFPMVSQPDELVRHLLSFLGDDPA